MHGTNMGSVAAIELPTGYVAGDFNVTVIPISEVTQLLRDNLSQSWGVHVDETGPRP